MIISYIPKYLLEDESISTLKEMGVTLEEGAIRIGHCKVNCIKVYNLTETQVFDKLDSRRLVESIETERNSYASRCMSVIFMKLRQVTTIKDKDLRASACCSLLAAVNSLAILDVKSANRFLPLIRSIN